MIDDVVHGITRDSPLRPARHLGWSVEEREVTAPGADFAQPLPIVAAVQGAATAPPCPASLVEDVRAAVVRERAEQGVAAVAERTADFTGT